MGSETDLIAVLIERQHELGEIDADFAKRIGMSRQTWQSLRTNGMQPGRRTLQGIGKAFPDLLPAIMALFVPRNASILTQKPANETKGATQ